MKSGKITYTLKSFTDKRIISKCKWIKYIFVIIFITGSSLSAIELENNSLANGLVKMFPTLKDAKWPYIDYDKSGDSRTEPGVPEIIWDRPGDGEGIIQAQEILDSIVYKDNFRFLSINQLKEIIDMLNKIGNAGGGGIMTVKVARSYAIDLEGLLERRAELPEIVTQNERTRVLNELSDIMQRLSKQYSEEADKEAGATFKGDLDKFSKSMEVLMKCENDDPMVIPFDKMDNSEGNIKENMARILGDEVINYNQRYIENKTAIFSIGKIGGRSALNVLNNLLKDQKFTKELPDLISALGMIGSETTPIVVDKIKEYLESSNDINIKKAAISTLGEAGNEKSIAILKKYIDTPPPGMEPLKMDALEALVNIAENQRKKGIASPELSQIFNKYISDPNMVIASLAVKGMAFVKNALPFPEMWNLLKKMDNFPDQKIIVNIIDTVEILNKYNNTIYASFIRSASQSTGVINYLNDCFIGKYKGTFTRFPQIRIRIARLIKEVTVNAQWLQGIDFLVDAIIDEDKSVRDEAGKLLIQISYETKISSSNAYGSSNASVSIVTYRAVIKKKDTPRLLEKGLQIISKQLSTDPRIAEYYFPFLADLDIKIVRQAVRGLNCILNTQMESGEFNKKGQLELVRALIIKNTLPVDIRISAVEVAGKIGYSDANSSGNNITKALYEILLENNSPDELKISAINAFPGLEEKQGRTNKNWIVLKDLIIDMVKSDNIMIRKSAVSGLSRIDLDTAEIRNALYETLNDENNKPIYDEILTAINTLNNPKSSEPIRDFLAQGKKLEPGTKKLAITAIGNCSDPDMIDVLIDALNDPDTEKEAKRGLRQMEPDELKKRVKQKIRLVTDARIKKELEDLLNERKIDSENQ